MPVQGVVGVIAGLWRQYDVRISATTMIEVPTCSFGIGSLVVQLNNAWYMGKLGIYEAQRSAF